MFKKVVFKKINFLKNCSDKCGALYETIKNLEDGNNVIHLHNKDLGRLWGQVNEEQILQLIKKNIGLYEVITKFPHKIYFDIDGEQECNLNSITDIIKQYFPDCKMSISGYETEEKKSYHIILNNYIIRNEDEQEQLKNIVLYLKTLNKYFDGKVYSKNRNMKAINQSKINKSVQSIILDDDEKNHLITFFINENSKTIENIKIENNEFERSMEQIKNNKNIDWSEIPKLKLTLPDNLDLDKPEILLSITPLNSDFNHKYTHKVARFCYYNEIPFNKFIEWYKNKSSDNENINKWQKHWNNLKDFPIITIAQYKNFLEYFYPTIKQNDFINLFNINNNKVKKTNYLTINDFSNDKKCSVLHLGMGQGKTENTIQYLKKNDNKTFIWITPNISLAHNTYNRIQENNINCNIYDSGRNKKEKQEIIENSRNIIICLNSLFYVKKHYDIIIIDEVETFLKLFYNNETLKNLNEIWEIFINLFKYSEKIILLDAFISKITVNFLENLNIDYEIIESNKNNNEREAHILKNFNMWINDIITNLKNNKKLLIFYPFKNQRIKQNLPSMEALKTQLEHLTKKKGIFHNADSSDQTNKKLKNVNEHWIKYDFVISNNKINVGLNFDIKYFDMCYLSIAGFNSARDIIQFSYRARHLKDNIIKYVFLDKFNLSTGMDKITVSTNNEIYNNLFNNVYIEKMADLLDSFEFFLTKAKYKINNKLIYEQLKNKINFIDNDFYSYEKIEDCESEIIKDLEYNVYTHRATTEEKITIRKYYFKKLFKSDANSEDLATLWNNNNFNLITKISKILYKDEIIKKLKENYNWTLYFPNKIDKNFNFLEEDLTNIFNNYKFKDLTQKSKHHLILKKYINHIYNYNVIKSEKDESKNYKFYICDKFKDLYLIISNNLK